LLPARHRPRAAARSVAIRSQLPVAIDRYLDLALGVGVYAYRPGAAAHPAVFHEGLNPRLFGGVHLQAGWLTAIWALERGVQGRLGIG
jgi:hypothetical protein